MQKQSDLKQNGIINLPILYTQIQKIASILVENGSKQGLSCLERFVYKRHYLSSPRGDGF